MRFLIRQRVFSWFDSFDIYDEEGNTAFTVKGRLSWGHNLHFFTPEGEDIAHVKEVVLTMFPKFEFYVHDEYLGMLRRRFSPFYPQYDMDFNGWHIDGDFLNWNWYIYDQYNNQIASIERKLFHLTDTYIIDVHNNEDVLYALMIVVAIDAERCTAAKAS